MKIDLFEKNVTTSLAIASAVLAVLVVTEFYFSGVDGQRNEDLASQQEVELPSDSPSVYVPPPIENFSAVLEKPLFFSDRKLPPEPVMATAAAAPRVPLRLHLEGVAITGEVKVAVLLDTANNQLLQLTEGMFHDGWVLDSVSPTSATFKRGEQVSQLLLDAGNTGPRRR